VITFHVEKIAIEIRAQGISVWVAAKTLKTLTKEEKGHHVAEMSLSVVCIGSSSTECAEQREFVAQDVQTNGSGRRALVLWAKLRIG
jgi:hypothetical protein